MTCPSSFLDGASVLPHCGLIRAQGDDAAAFLHSQLTNDVTKLGTAHARLAGYCSPKGRLLASFVVWKQAPDDIWLTCSADLLGATLKRLSMFVLRAKCRLTDVSGEFQLWGLAGESALRWLGNQAPATPWDTTACAGAKVIRLPDALGQARLLRVAPAGSAAPDLPALGLDAWRWGEVRSAVARIEAATVDQFVPQMLNFERVGGVDFHKGCYPGQEVVARSQYRGTTKRRSFVFDVPAPAHAGQEIFHSGDPGQPAGMVVNAAPRPDGSGGGSVLAEVKLSALQSGSLHLGDLSGPALAATAMPYEVLSDTAASD